MTRMQRAFLAALPRIEAHGRVFFRDRRCRESRDDAIAEMVAICWKWWVRLHERGKDPSGFVSAIASYAARAVLCGRRLCGQERARDVLSPLAQHRRHFRVVGLPDYSTLSTNLLSEALADNTETPPDEQAAFRLDFPAWLSSLGEQRRRVALELMVGERTTDVAARFRLSPGRISQMRREFLDDWQSFSAEPEACA